MARFTDNAGSEWCINLDAPLIAAVRKECQVNLTDLDGKAYEELAGDPVKLVEVLWHLVEEEAKQRGVSYKQFATSLTGDVLEQAADAMLEAITDFFPLRKRELLTAIASRNKKIREIGMTKALEKINDPELEKRIEEALEKRLDDEISSVLTQLSPATSSPGS